MSAMQLVNQIYWCMEVEEAFERLAAGDKGAMKVGRRRDAPGHLARACMAFCRLCHCKAAARCKAPVSPLLLQAYDAKQSAQLTRLIELTKTDLTKADRQKGGLCSAYGLTNRSGAACL